MKAEPIIGGVLAEQLQAHPTRKQIIANLEAELDGRTVVTFFTSFKWPVLLDDKDADMLENILHKTDSPKGMVLVISSPGGDGLAAERIVNICRNYSGTGEYWAIVPSKAKSAATIVCFGASQILMGGTSELGPIDPQVVIGEERFSVFNVVKSYENLFAKAVKEKSGNLEPYLQQLNRYDEREIEEFRSALALSEDIAVRHLRSGMMSETSAAQIKKKLDVFLTPEKTKSHGRPIYRDEAEKAGLKINRVDVKSKLWNLVFELYVRTDNYVSTTAIKCIETKDEAFFMSVPGS